MFEESQNPDLPQTRTSCSTASLQHVVDDKASSCTACGSAVEFGLKLTKRLTPHRFQEAMAQYTVDHVGRMKHIKATLDQPDETADAVQKKQDMLEELLDIVDNIDYARGASLARCLLLTTFVLYDYVHLIETAFIAKHIPVNSHVVIHHPTHPSDVPEDVQQHAEQVANTPDTQNQVPSVQPHAVSRIRHLQAGQEARWLSSSKLLSQTHTAVALLLAWFAILPSIVPLAYISIHSQQSNFLQQDLTHCCMLLQICTPLGAYRHC